MGRPQGSKNQPKGNGVGFNRSGGCDTVASGPDSARENQQAKIQDGIQQLKPNQVNDMGDYIGSGKKKEK